MDRAETASLLSPLVPDIADLEEPLYTSWGMASPGNGDAEEGAGDRALAGGDYRYGVDPSLVGTLELRGELLDIGRPRERAAEEMSDLPDGDGAVHLAAVGEPTESSTESEPSHRAPHDAILRSATDVEPDQEATWQSIADHGGTVRQAWIGDGGVWYHGPREITIVHDGLARSFIIDVPPGFDPGQAYSAVFAFHGGKMTAGSLAASTGISELADQRNFIAIYPNAADAQWNDGRTTTADGIDDVGFVQAIIAELEANWGLDPGQVYAAGISSGGMFVQRLALEAAEDFQAFAVVAANLPEELAGSSGPGENSPMVFFHGTEDLLAPFEGGEVPGDRLGHSAGGSVLSAEDTVEFWATANGAVLGEPEHLPDTLEDGTAVSVCVSSDGSVVQYVIEGGGHTWPGMDVTGLTALTGTVSQEIDATEIMVDFFEGYGL